ncbi:ABC transporter substrate binding protein [Treponema sp.]|uniref:ABC transporter substrate binding protein n=1 Tax=Treponema sp. TaxID=166 RepID=UPI003F04C590
MAKKSFLSILMAVSSCILLGSVLSLCFFLYKNRFASTFVDTQFNSTRANVLFLSSMPSPYAVSLQEKGFRRVFLKNKISVDIEYFELDNFYEDKLPEFLNERISYLKQNKKYDLVLVSGGWACTFIEENYDALFSGLPVVFFCIESNIHANLLHARENFWGIETTRFLSDTVSVVRKLYPSANHYVAIYDGTDAGWENYDIFVNAVKKIPGIKLSGMNTSKMPRNTMKLYLSALDENSVVFYLGALLDSFGKKYSMQEQAEFIVGSTSAPVFSHNANGVGLGFIGGKMLDYEKAAVLAANLVVSVLDGEKNIPLQKISEGKFIFDYEAIEERGLEHSSFPVNSVFVNMQDQFKKNSRGIFLGILGIIVSLSVFIILALFFIISEIRNSHALKSSNLKMEYMLEHDSLTDLPNRFKANSVFAEVKKSGKPYTLILFDIDDFKNINDFYSHDCGDIVLKTIASRLKLYTAGKDIFVSRFGGDEFLVLYIGGLLSEDSIEIQELRDAFEGSILFGENTIHIQSSFGVVTSKDCTIENMVQNADIALYRAKNSGKNRTVFFDEQMRDRIFENNRISKIIDDAIENDGIWVAYQPQIDAETGEIHGYEALMRLKNYNISPAKFIPIAEETGKIIKIDRILTEKVVKQMAEWRDHGIPLYRVSINYSYGQIADIHYVDFLDELLKRYNIPSELVCIEITESLLISNRESVSKLLNEFVGRGISLALDDFGTGYSSLSYLTFLPINIVKIDKSIVDNYLSNEKGDFIKNIVRLVHSLEMKLTVEGVEHQWQNEKLKSFHCDYIQGYYYSKPISGAEIEEFNRKFQRIS